MESVCPVCKKPYNGAACTNCTVTDLDISGLVASEGLQIQNADSSEGATAFLVDLVSNRKIPITTPRCKVGRDDLNDIVISGDQSISRFHFVISKENGQYYAQDGKSRHGTFLNGNQISGPEPIHDGDVLKVGVSLFWFVIEAAVPGAPGSDKMSPVEVTEQSHFVAGGGAAAVANNMPSAGPDGRGDASVKSQAETTIHLKIITPEEEKAMALGHAPPAAPAKDEAKAKDEPAQPEKSEPEAKGSEPKSDDKSSAKDRAEAKKVISSDNAEEEMTMDMLLNPLGGGRLTDSSPPAHNRERSRAEEKTSRKTEAHSEKSQTKETDLPEKKEDAEPAHKVSAQESSSTSESKDAHPEPEQADSAKAMPALEEHEKRLGNIEYQFGLSEQDITRAAERLAESYANDQPSDAEPAKDASEEPKAQETLEKLAEIVGGAKSGDDKKSDTPSAVPLSQYLSYQSSAEKSETEEPVRESDKQPIASSGKQHGERTTSNGAKSVMSSTLKDAASSTVPDWCKKYFASELNHLNRDLNELNDQVRSIQNKIRDVENRVALTKGLRNTLLTTQGDELIDACGKVLTMIGWRVRMSDDDKHEMRLENDDKNICIARIVWTEKEPDRSHLGQLSISQTRYWCEQGVEPKGILIISRVGENAGQPLSPNEYNGELSEYASKKNVCLMTTLQLLAIYKEVILHDGSPESVRNSIQNSSGWLHGFNLEPGAEGDKEESGTNKLSSLLSA